MLAFETQKQILIVDPDCAAVEPVRQRLSDLGFSVRHEVDGAAAINQFAHAPPLLVILDWNMPGVAAMELIRRARAVRAPRCVRLIILSALASEHDVVSGLESGADDYIAKPYSAREVVARVLAVLRPQRRHEQSSAMVFDQLELDSVTARVSVRGELLNLRGAEYRLLEFLMTHAGRTFSRDQLLSQVWGKDCDVDVRTVDVNVQRLRKILADPGYEHYIQTVRGFGYRFATPQGPG
jgi:two-component system, OmpR family, phosphate regulon response regulator PhoB